MTDTAIQTQIQAIKKATQKATASKEAALRFLQEAGIVRPKSNLLQTEKTGKVAKQ